MNYWDKEEKYKEVQRALNDYWITQKNIHAVHVKTEFIDENGCSFNDFYWVNPEIARRNSKIDKRLERIDESISSLRNERRELLRLKEAYEIQHKHRDS